MIFQKDYKINKVGEYIEYYLGFDYFFFSGNNT